MTPEQEARVNIDRLLERAGWSVQNADSINLYASSGVAVREFPLKSGHGTADYLLYVNQKAAGVVEAKPEGSTLTGVEVQSEKYSTGLPDNLLDHEVLNPWGVQVAGGAGARSFGEQGPADVVGELAALGSLGAIGPAAHAALQQPAQQFSAFAISEKCSCSRPRRRF